MRRTSREAMPAVQASAASQRRRSPPSIKAFDVIIAFAGTVSTFVWAAGIVPAGPESGGTSDMDALWVWASLIGFVAGSAVHTPIHELGHVLAAAAMRLQVVSVQVWRLRFGRPGQDLMGTSGHVTVEFAEEQRWLPVRMILFSLGGSAATVAVAVATATAVISHPSAPTGLRTLAVGFAVAGLCDAMSNLTPRRHSRHQESDGRAVLRWLFGYAGAQAGVGIRSGPVIDPGPGSPGGTKTTQQRRDYLLSEIGNTHPEVAIAAMTEFFRTRLRWDDGWQDYDVVATFAAREDLPADVRAKVSSQYCLSLALAHLVMLGPDGPTDPASPKVRQMEQLAELALSAKRESLQARTAMALVRVMQVRPAEARALLGDVTSSASPTVQARARAVLGIAEIDLGNLHRARALAALSRRIAPADSVVKLLHSRLFPTTPG